MISSTIQRENETLVIKSAEALDAHVSQAIYGTLQAVLALVVGISTEQYLTGPRPEKLGVVTSRLRGSITEKVTQTANEARGAVGTNVEYGAYHEFGLHRTVLVKAFTRATDIAGFQKIRQVRSRKDGSITNKSELYRFDDTGKIIGYKTTLAKLSAKKGLLGQTQFEAVQAHERKVDYAGRPFIRPAITQAEPFLLSELEKRLKPPPTPTNA